MHIGFTGLEAGDYLFVALGILALVRAVIMLKNKEMPNKSFKERYTEESIKKAVVVFGVFELIIGLMLIINPFLVFDTIDKSYFNLGEIIIVVIALIAIFIARFKMLKKK